ncbi:ABC transporter ATP-binding protein [Sanguibacter inulinus]|uniref:ABC transporter ATP-binding protein n=1 Tax=Sanguibacter inulinus TaxID=60922 RepID=A0A853EQM4_9MICO|nr:ABC transporter ATP-binding protein [Sanguibacter inulinus]MBF0720839.1 ABC transporter ATP-binding protein [Sanguibacter inulinus]NYS91984.1 ABC transporter ATP-binding protein [Sanguibacter inulinus]
MQVTLDAVGHRFAEGPWLFRGLSQTLLPARVYALTGPSGSGKSTLLSLLAGWAQPTQGRIRHDGVDRVGWVFQNPHGVPGRTARDHVALPLLARGSAPASADLDAASLLDRFGLGGVADQPFRSLSGGEAQRLMLARGVAAGPSLFLVDEPTAQLDLATGKEVNVALGQIATEGTIVVVATHDSRTRDACTDHIDLHDYQDGRP